MTWKNLIPPNTLLDLVTAMKEGVLGPDAQDSRNHTNKRSFDSLRYNGKK